MHYKHTTHNYLKTYILHTTSYIILHLTLLLTPFYTLHYFLHHSTPYTTPYTILHLTLLLTPFYTIYPTSYTILHLTLLLTLYLTSLLLTSHKSANYVHRHNLQDISTTSSDIPATPLYFKL